MCVIGTKFVSAKGANKAARGEVDAKHVLEGTMMKTMAKAQGQEVDDDDDYMEMREDLEKQQKEYQEDVDETETEFSSSSSTQNNEATTSPLFTTPPPAAEKVPEKEASNPNDDLD